jgi:hypothetical protein
MTNHEQDFDPPRIMLVKEVDGQFDFGLLPKDFRGFDSFQMLCAGLVVRSSEREFELLTSQRYTVPAGTGERAMREWQQRAIGFVQSQWQKYGENGFKLPGFPKQEETFDDMMSHSVRNLGTGVMSENEIKSLERILHDAFMAMLDRTMGLPTKTGLTGRYAMGGNA